MFERLDTDKDGTLDIKEFKGRLGRKAFNATDPDKDKTLTKDEYLRWSSSDSRLPARITTAPSGRRSFARLRVAPCRG